MFTGGGSTADRERRVVGVANYVVTDDGETLVAYGLGSCVAVGLYDPVNGIGALAHVMLPRQPDDATNQPGKFADATVRTMLEAVIDAGGSYASIEGWLVGGDTGRSVVYDTSTGEYTVYDEDAADPFDVGG